MPINKEAVTTRQEILSRSSMRHLKRRFKKPDFLEGIVFSWEERNLEIKRRKKKNKLVKIKKILAEDESGEDNNHE